MEQHMQEARMVAAQCWCDEETSGMEMDSVLAEAVARRIAAWMETAAQMAQNADFYRGLLDECAKHLGEAAYTADDGTVMDEPLLLKVPELVAALVIPNAELRGAKPIGEASRSNDVLGNGC